MVDSEYHDVFDTTDELESINDIKESINNICSINNNFMNDYEKLKNEIDNNEKKNEKVDKNINSNNILKKSDENNGVYEKYNREVKNTNSKSESINLYNNINDNLSKLKTMINYEKPNEKDKEDLKKKIDENYKSTSNENIFYNYTSNKNCIKISEGSFKDNNKLNELLKNTSNVNSFKNLEKNKSFLIKSNNENTSELKKSGSENIISYKNINFNNNISIDSESYMKNSNNLIKINEKFLNSNNNNYYSDGKKEFDLTLNNKKINKNIPNNFLETKNHVEDKLNRNDLDISLISSESFRKEFSFCSFNDKNNSNNFSLNGNDIKISNISNFSNISNLNDSEINDNVSIRSFAFGGNINNSLNKNIKETSLKEKNQTDKISSKSYIHERNNINIKSELANNEERYLMKRNKSDINIISSNNYNNIYNENNLKNINYNKKVYNNELLSDNLNENKTNKNNFFDYEHPIKNDKVLNESINKKKNSNNLNNCNLSNNINFNETSYISNEKELNKNYMSVDNNLTESTKNISKDTYLSNSKNNINYNQENYYNKKESINIKSNFDVSNNIFKNYNKETVLKKNEKENNIYEKNNLVKDKVKNTSLNFMYDVTDNNKKSFHNNNYKKINSNNMLNDLSLNKLESLNSSIIDVFTKNNDEHKFLDDIILDDSIFAQGVNLNKESLGLYNDNINKSMEKNYKIDSSFSEENMGENIFKISMSCNDTITPHYKKIVEDNNNVEKKEINENYQKIKNSKRNDYYENDNINFKQSCSNINEENDLKNNLKDYLYNKEKNNIDLNFKNLNTFEFELNKNVLLKNTMSLQKDYNIEKRKSKTSSVQTFNKDNHSLLKEDNTSIKNRRYSVSKTDIINNFSKYETNTLEEKPMNIEFEKLKSSLLDKEYSNELNKSKCIEFNNFLNINKSQSNINKKGINNYKLENKQNYIDENNINKCSIFNYNQMHVSNNKEEIMENKVIISEDNLKKKNFSRFDVNSDNSINKCLNNNVCNLNKDTKDENIYKNKNTYNEEKLKSLNSINNNEVYEMDNYYAQDKNKEYKNNDINKYEKYKFNYSNDNTLLISNYKLNNDSNINKTNDKVDDYECNTIKQEIIYEETNKELHEDILSTHKKIDEINKNYKNSNVNNITNNNEFHSDNMENYSNNVSKKNFINENGYYINKSNENLKYDSNKNNNVIEFKDNSFNEYIFTTHNKDNLKTSNMNILHKSNSNMNKNKYMVNKKECNNLKDYNTKGIVENKNSNEYKETLFQSNGSIIKQSNMASIPDVLNLDINNNSPVFYFDNINNSIDYDNNFQKTLQNPVSSNEWKLYKEREEILNSRKILHSNSRNNSKTVPLNEIKDIFIYPNMKNKNDFSNDYIENRSENNLIFYDKIKKNKSDDIFLHCNTTKEKNIINQNDFSYNKILSETNLKLNEKNKNIEANNNIFLVHEENITHKNLLSMNRKGYNDNIDTQKNLKEKKVNKRKASSTSDNEKFTFNSGNFSFEEKDKIYEKNDKLCEKNNELFKENNNQITSKNLLKEKNKINYDNINDVNIKLKDEIYNPTNQLLNDEKRVLIESYNKNDSFLRDVVNKENLSSDIQNIKTFSRLDKNSKNNGKIFDENNIIINENDNNSNKNDDNGININEKINHNFKINRYNEYSKKMGISKNNFDNSNNNNSNNNNSNNYNSNNNNSNNYNSYGFNYMNMEKEHKNNLDNFNYDDNFSTCNNDYINNKDTKCNNNSMYYLDKFNSVNDYDMKKDERSYIKNNEFKDKYIENNYYYKNKHENNDHEKDKKKNFFFNNITPNHENELRENAKTLNVNDYEDKVNIFNTHHNNLENKNDKNPIELNKHINRNNKDILRNVYNEGNDRNYLMGLSDQKIKGFINKSLDNLRNNRKGTTHEENNVEDDLCNNYSNDNRNNSIFEFNEENKRKNNTEHVNMKYSYHKDRKKELQSNSLIDNSANVKYNNDEMNNLQEVILNDSLSNRINIENINSNKKYQNCNNFDINVNYKYNNLNKENKKYAEEEYFNYTIKESNNGKYLNLYNKEGKSENNNFHDLNNNEKMKFLNEKNNFKEKFNYDHKYNHTDNYMIENNKEILHKHYKDNQKYDENISNYPYEEEIVKKQKNSRKKCDNKNFNNMRDEKFPLKDDRKKYNNFREMNETYLVKKNEGKWDEQTIESLRNKKIDEESVFFNNDKDNNYVQNNKNKIISNMPNGYYTKKNKDFYNDSNWIEDEHKQIYIEDDNNYIHYQKENNYNDKMFFNYDENSKKEVYENFHINNNYDKNDVYYKNGDKYINDDCNYKHNKNGFICKESITNYKDYDSGYNMHNNYDYFEYKQFDYSNKIMRYDKNHYSDYNHSNMNNKINNSDNNNELENKKYYIYDENNDILKNENNSDVLNKIMNVMMNIQNDLKDVKYKLIKKKSMKENEEINDKLKRKNSVLCIKNINTKMDNSKKFSTYLKEDNNKIDKNNSEIYSDENLKKINNNELENNKMKKYSRINRNTNNNTYIEEDKVLNSQYSKDIKYHEYLSENFINDNESKNYVERESNNINYISNKELYNSLNFVLKNLNYESIEDSDVSKSNRLYLFNKFFTSLFYEDNKKTHNFIMLNIYNIEQKRQTHKVSLFLEKDYSDIFHYAYNNLLFYAFDCYNFYRYIKNKFRDSYKIYENSTICLYISNNYETNLINRIFIEQNNYNDVKYSLNERRILKTCTKYFLDHFLSLIDKKINIKNVVPLMKKINYEFDKNNLYFFISEFNLMDKIFSDSHGFDCNKKFFEKKCPNIKNFAIFFKLIHDATNFYDTFINNNKINLDNYRLIIVALHKGKSFNYDKLSFNEFMKTSENQIYNYYNNYDSMSFDNDIVILFNLSYAVPFYYIEYYKN
ncbi:conserved Plasmodium protein, unknown function [Plasmodium gallinaceum]|uniref:Uncharacterized protein n=1 Tax=Plasmodium gallinaceum TaxID=5849 RepID=A0A1J1GVR1_PLAGA|nr:conserved Plasmodium protein, unknown function [Plasmodium gallinaceum]CRG96412.1 conserved Plasmodium protein, unknown function [Plasmodium gallinaceum]